MEHDIVGTLVVEEIAIAPVLSSPSLEGGVGVLVILVEERFDHTTPPKQSVATPRRLPVRYPSILHGATTLPESLQLRLSYMRAERTPSIVQADRLARALGTTLSAMLAEVERTQSDAS
jgi:hypothetical protein